MTISKSKFVAGAQCLKRLYLQVHQPELAAEPDASGSAIMEQGQEVGRLAHQLFPGGVKVDGSACRGIPSAAHRLTTDTGSPKNSEICFQPFRVSGSCCPFNFSPCFLGVGIVTLFNRKRPYHDHCSRNLNDGLHLEGISK